MRLNQLPFPLTNLSSFIKSFLICFQKIIALGCLKNNGHRIDILSKEYIIEIKCYSNRIKAIGRVKYYQVRYPNRKLWIHIFNHNDNKDGYFEEACERDNIKLTYE